MCVDGGIFLDRIPLSLCLCIYIEKRGTLIGDLNLH